eukprot:9129278-Pyramimonas_sp.AAC.1
MEGGCLHIWRAAGFLNVVLALVPHLFVLNNCSSFADGGRVVLNMWFSPYRRGHSLASNFDNFTD